MTLNELMLFLHHLEENYPVNDWEIDGIHVWPLVRTHIGTMGSANKSNYQEQAFDGVAKWKSRMATIIQPFSSEAKLFFRDHQHTSTIGDTDIVMFVPNAGRTIVLPTGELMHRILGPIRIAFEDRGYRVFEFESIQGPPRYPRWKDSYPIDILAFRAITKSRFMSYQNCNLEMDSYRAMQKECSASGIPEESFSPRRIFYEIKRIEELAKLFFSKLKKIMPRIVILVGWESFYSMALSLAAHQLQLPIVEIQHGMAAGTNVHFAYYEWSKLPVEGYGVMPDYMWVWWQTDYDAIERWGGSSVVPILGGRPAALLFGDTRSSLCQYYMKMFDEMVGKGDPLILFTLGWGTYYPEWLLEFINESENYIWLIRLHPKVDETQRDFLRKLKDKKNIIWKNVDTVPLDFLLPRVSLHITMNSSVVVEGEGFNCPSIFMDQRGFDFFAPQIQSGLAQYAGSRERLLAAIENVLKKVKREKQFLDSEKDLYNQGGFGIQKLIEIMKVH